MSKLSVSAWLLIPSILILAFWIRVQGTEGLSDKQFTETDAYFYYWQAHLISEHGQLPTRDMHRWLPLGRDLGQTLNLYGYVLAYTHRAIAAVFGDVTLYHITLYMPPICFCVGLGALCLFLYHTQGLFFASSVGVILATLPGSIERSAAGFGDRDAFCLMIGILSLMTYLMSLQTEKQRRRLFWTFASGLAVFLGGISWEGFGVFLSIIMVLELWRFLTNGTQEGFRLYLLWVLCFVPTLYLASPAYRNGYGFAEHLATFVLVPPIVLLGIRAIRFLLMEKISVLRQHTRLLSLGLTIASLALASTYIFVQYSTFDNTTVPLSQNAVMQTMTELKAPHFWYWMARYGSIFVLGSLGFVLMPFILWKKQGSFLSILIALFAVFSFFREPLDKVWGEPFGNALFGIVIMMCLLTLIFLAWKRKNTDGTSEFIPIAFTVWFIVWVALSRDAKRYDFFTGVALAFGNRNRHTISFKNRCQENHSQYKTSSFSDDPKKRCYCPATHPCYVLSTVFRTHLPVSICRNRDAKIYPWEDTCYRNLLLDELKSAPRCYRRSTLAVRQPTQRHRRSQNHHGPGHLPTALDTPLL